MCVNAISRRGKDKKQRLFSRQGAKVAKKDKNLKDLLCVLCELCER
jgi:hypothetical protein